ncbi:hypothetical protein GH714_033125 [Hevea brasiliensis]|uniref:RING-type domain-containing protein n=1 Tax=Hevea brasiliensis TaxID=3981 RepID=A0A6A6KD54_HEVBR|nr:hypothetical protein GH714_033125 [Hevea brasiliensis]
MASSQVEIASSSPFGCILKDHNRRERCTRETNARAAASTQAAFQKNLRELVRDRLHTCISVSSDENSRNNVNNSNNNNISHHHRQHLRCLTNHPEDNTNNVDESSTISCKQERILDRWAAKQAQEMVSTIERQSREADFLIASQKTSSSAIEISHNSQNFVAQHENLSGNSNLGASSLVQIWEARLSRPEPKMDRSNSLKINQNTATSASRTSSGSSFIEIVSSSVEEPQRQSDIIDSAVNEEPLADWDSTAQSSRSSVHFRGSDVGENERVRIADIIKRLTSESSDQEQGNSVGDLPSRRHSYGSDQAELKALSHVINSPKIRGRQALNDLLFQMEQERQRELVSLSERQTVSRFPQRGRIQSMLRLRCLQRGMAIQNQQRSQSIRSTIASDAHRSQQSSTIMHLRERFNAGVEQGTSLSDATATQGSGTDTASNIVINGNPSTPIHVLKDNHHQEDSSNSEQQAAPTVDNSLSQTSEIHEQDAHEESSASSDVSWQGTCSEGDNFDQGEVLESTPSINNWNGNEMDDEEIVDQQDLGETNYDWFADIARPRSYWENRRQAWYQEMLTSGSENNEIRQLLERSWNYRHRHEVANDSEQVPTATSPPLLPSEASNQYSGHLSSRNTSMELELIYNLRGHMEQLQREMSELRRSMQTCMEVQAKLLNSLRQEVHPVQEAAMNSFDIATKRRSCCICYEMQVDSFLYRCGHMCTCLKCAHELQWSSGKCPMCRAPIMDVVRAYMDS